MAEMSWLNCHSPIICELLTCRVFANTSLIRCSDVKSPGEFDHTAFLPSHVLVLDCCSLVDTCDYLQISHHHQPIRWSAVLALDSGTAGNKSLPVTNLWLSHFILMGSIFSGFNTFGCISLKLLSSDRATLVLSQHSSSRRLGLLLLYLRKRHG